MSNIENKMYQSVEFKSVKADDDGKKRFEGYLAKFGNVDSYGDIIEKGAFINTIAEAKAKGKTIPVLEQHGAMGITAKDNTPIGYFEEMHEDDNGLYVKGVLYSTTSGNDMYTLLKESPKGAMGMSIGYRAIGVKYATDEEYRTTGVLRYLTEVSVHEGSIVTFPANEEARVEDVKATDPLEIRKQEKYLKENGFSSTEAKKIMSLLKNYKPVEKTEESSKSEVAQAINNFFEEEDYVESLKKSIDNIFV